MTSTDFQGINAAALRNARSLLPRLIPGGRFRSREYIALNPRRPDRNLGSFKVNYKTGEWADFAIENAKGGDLISLTAYVRDTTQGNAARELAEMVGISVPRVSGAGHNGTECRGDTRSCNVVMPVPANSPVLPTTHPTLGQPTQSWPYEDAAGRVIGHVLRFDFADGKEFRPLTLWRHAATDKLEWRWESWPIKRPLYGLRELAERPFAPVVVCEGEKSADAAERQLTGFVAVTSPNGSNNADKADWSSLQGREAIIWPDADTPGHE
jgi:putative DNA primase/helicase